MFQVSPKAAPPKAADGAASLNQVMADTGDAGTEKEADQWEWQSSQPLTHESENVADSGFGNGTLIVAKRRVNKRYRQEEDTANERAFVEEFEDEVARANLNATEELAWPPPWNCDEIESFEKSLPRCQQCRQAIRDFGYSCSFCNQPYLIHGDCLEAHYLHCEAAMLEGWTPAWKEEHQKTKTLELMPEPKAVLQARKAGSSSGNVVKTEADEFIEDVQKHTRGKQRVHTELIESKGELKSAFDKLAAAEVVEPATRDAFAVITTHTKEFEELRKQVEAVEEKHKKSLEEQAEKNKAMQMQTELMNETLIAENAFLREQLRQNVEEIERLRRQFALFRRNGWAIDARVNNQERVQRIAASSTSAAAGVAAQSLAVQETEEQAAVTSWSRSDGWSNWWGHR